MAVHLKHLSKGLGRGGDRAPSPRGASEPLRERDVGMSVRRAQRSAGLAEGATQSAPAARHPSSASDRPPRTLGTRLDTRRVSIAPARARPRSVPDRHAYIGARRAKTGNSGLGGRTDALGQGGNQAVDPVQGHWPMNRLAFGFDVRSKGRADVTGIHLGHVGRRRSIV